MLFSLAKSLKSLAPVAQPDHQEAKETRASPVAKENLAGPIPDPKDHPETKAVPEDQERKAPVGLPDHPDQRDHKETVSTALRHVLHQDIRQSTFGMLLFGLVFYLFNQSSKNKE